MERVVLTTLFLCTGCLSQASEPSHVASQELTALPQAPSAGIDTTIRSMIRQLSQTARNWGTGAVLGSVSLLAKIGWEVSKFSPWESPLANEFLLLSHVCGSAARALFAQPFPTPFLTTAPSHHSWKLNQLQLGNIPAPTPQEEQLLHFLEKRWLAKSTGFYPTLVDWVCPCFGIQLQVHPETTSSYARDPWNKISQTYKNRIDDWIRALPHPHHFPLILTRPASTKEYLPSVTTISSPNFLFSQALVAAQKVVATHSPVILDLTQVLSKEPKKWKTSWKSAETAVLAACQTYQIPPSQLLCIQHLFQDHLGGIRILPLQGLNSEQIERQHQFLLERISKFGLSANRVELDRWSLASILSTPKPDKPLTFTAPSLFSKEEFLNQIETFNQHWNSQDPEQTLMVQGTLQALKGLIVDLPQQTWMRIAHNPTLAALAQLSCANIARELNLIDETSPLSFYHLASRIEQIHANLTTLLEVFSPYTAQDFASIYQKALTTIPPKLQPLTQCTIHSSGMTNLAGIFKAVEQANGRPPRILYGDNTYFENIYAAHKISTATPLIEATDEDYAQADLILSQFNPILRRIDYKVTDYKVENVAETLRNALEARAGKPITLALDCTIDYLDSPRVGALLTEFEEAIEQGLLNIICYRSGLKFDLFGMDNYCGAPLFMIHSQDAAWNAFDTLITDPLLQTDHLSLNWFCLAFSHTADQLELYRKHIFNNTRELINKVPERLLTDTTAKYRIVPMDPQADAAFLDIKIYGPFHQLRCSLIGGFLTFKCLEKQHPLFYRPSLGFYHPNLSILYSEECSTIRLTLGLDPSQVDIFVDAFTIVDSLNDRPEKMGFGLPFKR